ncbi:hypothetical protein PACTADRAFT_76829 [Pachysolen tannophilus NRRL Y-2460]|uniref:Cytochrome c oxidase-assembly factor COX23, mitochondrial n=1 Tax=Pachysolen tannophilus NRRL Y-2460 TaxID=669874 RepID=A0A1E4TQZ5_PACTA|nr:hypothetical protein PACTADRAFT_76829 [Pachysolen tannophilus NRRL Y-2460]
MSSSDNQENKKDDVNSKKVDFTRGSTNEGDFKYYPDEPTQKVHKDIFVVKAPSQYYDPCGETSRMAIRCMENHDHDYKQICGEYFRAYRECKKEWLEQRRKGNSS